ncbi:hypothetical protein DICVIV_07576 [Dictyocaulus viviparus]|uniref:Vitellogenin domain-containing protein n=1 Tax=Dictyocaulus viviparus TaxID=29172 RepID=A0A0D8XVI7_DICVI|nr:hypothetical protein DICVIV_07576 [Dictyocaulus viviparus]
MLQINQLKKEEYDNDPREGEANNNKYFVAVERTFEGECEVEYTINNLPEGKTQWSKSINFQKCNTHPQIEYGMHPGRTDKSTNEKMFSTIIKHQVSETKGKILITEAELHSQYKLVPMSKKHEMITSVVHSKITLIYGGKVETAIHKLRRDRKETLIYNSELEMYEEKFAMTGDEKFLHRIPEWKNKVEHIEKLLSIIIRHLDEKIELETTHHFARLVKLLRLCSEGDLIKIQRFLTNQKKTNYNVMSIYYDALAMAGTRITVTELANIVNSEKIDSLRAVRLVKSLSEVPVPSEEIADQILSICEGEVAERVPYLKQACWLTYGAIYNRICWNERLAVQYVENICKRGLKEKFVGKLIDMFKKSDTRYEKVLMLKSLGNAGLDISVYSLEEIIHNKNEEKSVRNEAINALRKLCQFMPRKVQNILMPIFKDRTEVPQVRMSALRIIMETMPRQVVVDQIVHQMEIERDHNIRSFIFNVLKSISQSTKTEEMTAFSVNKALRTIKTEFYEKLNNRVPTWTANNEDMQYGTTLSLQYLFTKDSILPKDLLASLDTIIGGKLYKHFAQLGFSQQDIDNILSKLLHKFEESGLEQIVVRGRRSTKYRASDIFRAISEKLNLVRRNNKKEDPQMMFYVRYKDMDYAFLPIDINTIPKLFGNVIRDGKIQLDEIEHILATGTQFQSSAGFFIYESVRKIPTALGLPLVLTSNMPTVVTVQGHIKVELEPKRSSILNGLRVRLLLKPRVATTHVIKAIAFYPAVESGFKLLHSATFEHPLNCEIEVMMKDQFRTKLVFRPPEHRTNLIHYQSRPAVLIRHIKKITHAYPESTEVTVHLHKQLYPTENFEYNYLKKYGTLVKMMGTIHRQVIRKTESFLNPILIGYNTLDIMTEPTQDMAEEYVFNMELETFVPVIMEKPTVDKLFKTHDEFSEVDGEDLEQRRGGDRRAQIYTYLKNLDIGKAYQHRIVFKFETIGQRDKNEIEVELVAKCENKYRYCQTQLRGRRSPLVMEKSKWEMNVEVQTVYPETPKTLNNLKKFHREFHGFINARWGNQETNNVLIRMQGEQSREQKLWMKNYNQIFKSKLTEMERVKLASDLNLYKFVASYRFTPETEYYISKLFSFLNIWQMWNIDYAITKNEEGRVRAQLNIDPLSRRTFDLHIYTPQSRIVIKKVALPFSFASVTVHNPNLDEITSMKDIISHVFKNNRAECIIKSSNVNTFDNMYFKFPLTTCYTVMAKDCSNEDPKFAVLLKKKEKNRKEKKLKLITRQNVYEIEMRNNELIGKLNGREIGLEDKKVPNKQDS